jgi:hypothetical protein
LETVFSVVRAAAVAVQQRGKYISTAMNPDVTIQVMRAAVHSGLEPGNIEITIVRNRYQETSNKTLQAAKDLE